LKTKQKELTIEELVENAFAELKAEQRVAYEASLKAAITILHENMLEPLDLLEMRPEDLTKYNIQIGIAMKLNRWLQHNYIQRYKHRDLIFMLIV
jgi:ABC-type transporter MlaC component